MKADFHQDFNGKHLWLKTWLLHHWDIRSVSSRYRLSHESQLPLTEKKEPVYSTLDQRGIYRRSLPVWTQWLSAFTLQQWPQHMRVAAKRKFSNYLCNTWGDSSIVEDHTLTEPNPLTTYDAGMLLQNLIILRKQGITLGSIKENKLFILHCIYIKLESNKNSIKTMELFNTWIM